MLNDDKLLQSLTKRLNSGKNPNWGILSDFLASKVEKLQLFSRLSQFSASQKALKTNEYEYLWTTEHLGDVKHVMVKGEILKIIKCMYKAISITTYLHLNGSRLD